MAVNILCIGDVVGPPGRGVLSDHLEELIAERSIELVVCNAENVAGGSGLTPQIFNKLLRYGVDVVTLGDHCFRKQEIIPTMRESDRVVRPANLLPKAAGKRWTVVPTKSGRHRVAVTVALGQMFMKQTDSPFTAVDSVLNEVPSDVIMRVMDFHAEASSEKIAMGWYLDGRMSLIFGTHTHIPTADARILPKGTGYISDVGMTGPYDGVLGRKKERVLQYMTTSMPARFDVAQGDPRLCGVLAAVNPASGRTESIERIEVRGRTEKAESGR